MKKLKWCRQYLIILNKYKRCQQKQYKSQRNYNKKPLKKNKRSYKYLKTTL